MKTSRSSLPVVFALVMILFVLFIIWYLPSAGELRFRIDDIGKSIETSRGRERKQQHEYDETVSAIPKVQAEIDRVRPLADTAALEITELKAERKRLRAVKKALEAQLQPTGTEEAAGDE